MRPGINVGTTGYYSPQRAFADLMRAANSFATTAPRRLDGFPVSWPCPGVTGARPMSILASGMELPAGDYTLEATGTGVVSLLCGPLFGETPAAWHDYRFGGGTTSHVVHSPAGKRFDDDSYLYVAISSSSAADPIRGLHLYSPDRDPASPWTPAFIDQFKWFDCLRFMQCMNTIGSTKSTYADMVAGGGRFNRNGGSWYLEDCIDLCNRTGKDLWINLPQEATPECIGATAAVIDQGLDPVLKVYAEYSNETWNWSPGYTAWRYLQARWQLYRTSDAGKAAPLSFPQYCGKRHADALNAFGAALRPGRRCIRVAATQNGDTFAWMPQIQYMWANGGFDAIAVSLYFFAGASMTADAWSMAVAGHARGGTAADAAVNTVLDSCIASIDTTIAGLRPWADYAAQIGVPVVAYEAGQSIDWDAGGVRKPLVMACQRHPRMRDDLYPRLAAGMRSCGVALVNWFTDCSDVGRTSWFGHLDYTGQPAADAPKFAAISGPALYAEATP